MSFIRWFSVYVCECLLVSVSTDVSRYDSQQRMKKEEKFTHKPKIGKITYRLPVRIYLSLYTESRGTKKQSNTLNFVLLSFAFAQTKFLFNSITFRFISFCRSLSPWRFCSLPFPFTPHARQFYLCGHIFVRFFRSSLSLSFALFVE